MIASVCYTSAAAAVAITMHDGTVWHTDASLPADTDIRRALHEWLDAGNVPEPYTPPAVAAKAQPTRAELLAELDRIAAQIAALPE